MGEHVYVPGGAVEVGENEGVAVILQARTVSAGACASLASTSNSPFSNIREMNSAVSGKAQRTSFFPAARISSGEPWGAAEPSRNFRALSQN